MQPALRDDPDAITTAIVRLKEDLRGGSDDGGSSRRLARGVRSWRALVSAPSRLSARVGRSSHRCRSRFQSHSRNRRSRSGKSRLSLTKYPRRSQSASPGHCRSMVRGPDRSGRTRHTRGPARRNADSVAHRTTPCASGREARRSLDRCPVSFIDLDLGRGNPDAGPRSPPRCAAQLLALSVSIVPSNNANQCRLGSQSSALAGTV